MRDEYRLILSAPSWAITCAYDEMPASRQHRDAGATWLEASWALCHVVDQTSGETVGMGRLIGDGGW